jgi:TonB family protein
MNGLNYLMQSNLYLIVFFSFYWLLLRKETFNNFNRAFLIISGLTSFMIPLWNLNLVQDWFITQKTSEVFESLKISEYIIQKPSGNQSFSLTSYLPIIYGVICTGFALKFLANIFNLYRFINSNETLYNAFSFFNNIFIANDIDPDDVIYNHERVHASQYHSFDVLLFEIIGIFCWFNPIIYAYKIAIKNIHEFIADEIASDQLGSKVEYAMLLFSERFQSHPSVLVSNFFNKTSLKLRIEMLNKKKSHRMAVLKYCMIAPIFMCMMVFTSVAIANGKKISDLLSLATEKTIYGKVINFENKPIKGATVLDLKTNKGTQTDALGNFILKITGTEASLMFSHVSYKSKNIKVLSDNEVTITMRRYTNELSGAFVLGTNPKIAGMETAQVTLTDFINDENNNSNPKLIEQNAEFIGGPSAMYTYLRHNLRYPEEAKKNNKEGIVFTKFTIDETGSISKVRSISPLGYVGFVGYGLEAEAKRVIQSMPKWKPAMQNGKPESVEYALPIQFILDTDKKLIKADTLAENPIFLLDGKEITKEEALDPKLTEKITEISVFKGQDAIKRYGDKGKNGVVVMISKKENPFNKLGVHVENDEIFTEVEQQAEFPGGQGALGKYVSSNIKYPIYAERDRIEGKVFLSFIVTKSGAVSEISILKGLTDDLNSEAIRVVRSMPNWKPAIQSGRAVNSRFILPIMFSLNEKKQNRAIDKNIITIEGEKKPITTPTVNFKDRVKKTNN